MNYSSFTFNIIAPFEDTRNRIINELIYSSEQDTHHISICELIDGLIIPSFYLENTNSKTVIYNVAYDIIVEGSTLLYLT
jgi:hypothetical protein